jgi:hypothetical protein
MAQTLITSQNGAGVTTCPPSSMVGLERTRFFARQLVGPDDLTQDQLYFREKARRHNRLLHGWGIVCGARVKNDPDVPCGVIVEPGYILGPYGDEILIDQETPVDLCSQALDGNAVSPCASVDPWCADVRVDRPSGQPLYLAVMYAECEARPVRVFGDGCGCDQSDCAYSRTRDSFAMKVLDTLPSTYSDMTPPSPGDLFSCPPAPDGNGECVCVGCASCPTEPWVILADVTLDSGTVGNLDCYTHRRYVASYESFFFVCRAPTKGQPAGRAGFTRNLIEAMRTHLQPAAFTRLMTEHGAGAEVSPVSVDATNLRGVTTASLLGKALSGRTVSDVAAVPRDQFVESVLREVPPARATTTRAQATELWNRAEGLVNATTVRPPA